MARLKLVDYLNDPMLLKTISKEEMIAWAAEVPYAGLVQRLLVQKLAMEASSDQMTEEATTMAILTNANPDKTIQSIEDFKRMILSDSDKKVEESNLVSDGHGVSDKQQPDEVYVDNMIETQQEPILEVSEIQDSPDDFITSEESPFDSTSRSEESSDSDFTNWLRGLTSLEVEEGLGGSTLELEDKALASDALAQLLVAQGHYDKAIEMYELLMLKNPQKSSFFAAQIQKLKAL